MEGQPSCQGLECWKKDHKGARRPPRPQPRTRGREHTAEARPRPRQEGAGSSATTARSSSTSDQHHGLDARRSATTASTTTGEKLGDQHLDARRPRPEGAGSSTLGHGLDARRPRPEGAGSTPKTDFSRESYRGGSPHRPYRAIRPPGMGTPGGAGDSYAIICQKRRKGRGNGGRDRGNGGSVRGTAEREGH